MNGQQPSKPQHDSYAPDMWLIASIIWTALAGICWTLTDSAANSCRNVLVDALDQNQCTTVTYCHDLALLAAVAGVLGIVFSGMAIAKRNRA